MDNACTYVRVRLAETADEIEAFDRHAWQYA